MGQLGHQQGVQRRDAGRGGLQARRLHLRAERQLSIGSTGIPPSSDFIYVTTPTLGHDQLQQLSDEVGPDRTLLVLCSAFRGASGGLSEPHGEEDSQGRPHPLRVGPRRLQPEGREPAQGPPPPRPDRTGSIALRTTEASHEPPRQRHRRPAEPAPAAAQSLEILDRVTEIVPPQQGARISPRRCDVIRSEFPTVTDFEREFPSLCFALATGVGKTRLMGAFISYLHLAHGINNFFVLAPNLTIYNKLITDFTPNTPKYVFKGIAEFATDAAGDHHRRQLRGEGAARCSTSCSAARSTSSTSRRSTPRCAAASRRASSGCRNTSARAISNIWPGCPTSCCIMDESHRYRASAGVRAINELKPMLGLGTDGDAVRRDGRRAPCRSRTSSTTTRSAGRWQDGFVKEPAVVTRKNFNPAGMSPEEIERLKLEDGIRLHERREGASSKPTRARPSSRS